MNIYIDLYIDGGYPLKNWLLTTYRDIGNLNYERKQVYTFFNQNSENRCNKARQNSSELELMIDGHKIIKYSDIHALLSYN